MILSSNPSTFTYGSLLDIWLSVC